MYGGSARRGTSGERASTPAQAHSTAAAPSAPETAADARTHTPAHRPGHNIKNVSFCAALARERPSSPWSKGRHRPTNKWETAYEFAESSCTQTDRKGGARDGRRGTTEPVRVLQAEPEAVSAGRVGRRTQSAAHAADYYIRQQTGRLVALRKRPHLAGGALHKNRRRTLSLLHGAKGAARL